MAKNLSDMTMKELELMVAELDQKRAALRDNMRAVQQEISRRVVAQNAADKLARLSDDERAVLAQILQVDGIAGLEAFGDMMAER